MSKPAANEDGRHERFDVDRTEPRGQTSLSGIRYSDSIGTIRVAATQSLESAATVWRAFERRAISTPFQTYVWLENWQSQFGAAQGTTPHIVLGHDQSDSLCMIMPLAVRRRRGVRTLSWLGEGLAALHAPIIRPETIPNLDSTALDQLWRAILESAGEVDLVHLSNQPERIGRYLNPLAKRANGQVRSLGCVLSLPSHWPAFVESQMSSHRREQSSLDADLLRRQGQIEIQLDLQSEERKFAIERVFTAARIATTKRHSVNPYADKSTSIFFQALAMEQMANPLSVSVLNLGDSMIACTVGYSHQDNYYVSLTLTENSERGDAAERMLCEQLVRSCIAQGMNSVEFLSGTSPFPEWGGGAHYLCERIEATSGRGRRSIGLMKARRAVRRVVGMSDERAPLPARFRLNGAELKRPDVSDA